MSRFNFFLASINRKSGGSSSILDLSSNISTLNKEVKLHSVLGFLDILIYKPSNFNKDVKVYFQDYKVVKDLEYKPNRIKIYINLLLNKILKTPKDIKDSIVFDATRLPSWYIDILKKNSNKIVLNHAGSPNSFIKYFGMHGKERSNYEKAKNDYLTYVNRYDYFWFQSNTQANEFLKLTGFDDKRVIVLTPGANENDINSAKQIELSGAFNIVVVGSVHKRKGQHYIIDIAQKIPDAMFHIVGNIADKQYYEDIEKEIKEKNIKNIKFYGFKRDYLNYIKSADIILQLSEEEGVSRILREAMALGKPIVSFLIDGTRDLLDNNSDSLLVEYLDIDGIINSIKKLKDDNKLRDNIGLKAKENYENNYSNSVYIKKLKEAIKVFDE